MVDNLQSNLDFEIKGSFAHMLHRLGQIAADFHQKEFGRDGLSPRQFAVLAALAKKPNISQTELVQITSIDRSTMAEIIKRLLDKGLIERAKAPNDARANVLSLSGPGEIELNTALPKAKKIDAELLALLDEKSQIRVFGIFAKLLGEDLEISSPKKSKKDKKAAKDKGSKKAKKFKEAKP